MLLAEVRTWSPDAEINWTKLRIDMKLTCANRGQVVNEFFAENNIPAALKVKKVSRPSKLKLPGGEVSFPVHCAVAEVKKSLKGDIERGEICLGKEIVPNQYTSFTYNGDMMTITENTTLQGRMISITDVRKILLRKQYEIGILRCVEMQEMDNEQLLRELAIAHATVPHTHTRENILSAVRKNQTTRFLKMWHDHGKIAGHGHFLVLVSSIFDPAFYFTTEEMAQRGVTIDVPSVVEEPKLYILARSGGQS